MKNWVGKWLIVIAIAHLLISFIVFGEPLRQILAEGGIASGNVANVKLTAIYLISGLFLLITGVISDGLHAQGRQIPKPAIILFLIVAIAGIVCIPLSAFWLAFPPAFALLIEPWIPRTT